MTQDSLSGYLCGVIDKLHATQTNFAYESAEK